VRTSLFTHHKRFCFLVQVNKRILALCVGNHYFFMTRRRAQANGEVESEDRATLEAKLRKTKEQLLAIRMDLEKVKDASKTTKEDTEHEKREAEGMDKFMTMKKAQAGDAKRRILDFENLEEAEC
jgi:radixin